MRIGVEPPYRRTARCAPRREGEVRERRLGELPRRALGEVLVRHAAEVGAQEALRQLVAPAAAGRGARDALDQRDGRGGDAAEQPVFFDSNWGGHAQSSCSGNRRCRVDLGHILLVNGARLYLTSSRGLKAGESLDRRSMSRTGKDISDERRA